MLSAQRGKNGEPHPTPVGASTETVASKRDLTSWWKNFKRGNPKREEEKVEPISGIFEVPLLSSVRYANVAISLFDNEGKSYIYGYVPIIVAKCGVFLKEKATEVEGIFRLSGSEKRIKELRAAFDSSERRYGKGLDWTGYTVHDAANILRRYFNTLPEPIIPLQYYELFRDPIRGHQAQAVGEIDGQHPIIGEFDADAAIRTYQTLVTEIPPLNRQLLLYILDLLAVFAAKSDINKMTTANLAAIFQPGILSHPSHDMAPPEYRLSQDVLIFLINNQDHFLIGMQGTAADAKTVQDVESGPPKQVSTPTRTKTSINRSASNASAGADSIRKFGGMRRNVSVSSRNSKGSVAASAAAAAAAAPSPVTPSFTSSGAGVHRSNTVPSKKSPAIGATRMSRPRERPSDPPTPTSARTSQPNTIPQLGITRASTSQPGAIQPASIQPASIQPTFSPAASPRAVAPLAASSEAAAIQPSPFQPISGQPSSVQPSSVQPSPSHPSPSQTSTFQPATSQQAISLPAASLPVSSLPITSQLASSPPVTSQLTTAPIVEASRLAAPEVTSPSSSETTPLAEQPRANPLESAQAGKETPETPETPDTPKGPVAVPSGVSSAEPAFVESRNEERVPGSDFVVVPGRTFTQMFARGSAADQERRDMRKPNKLQKRRGAGSTNASAHSSTHSLTAITPYDAPPSPAPAGSSSTLQSSTKEAIPHTAFDTSPQKVHSLKPQNSPSGSLRSHSTTNDVSEVETGEETPVAGASTEAERKKRWRLSHHREKAESKEGDLGRNAHAQQSMSSISSAGAGARGRKSFEPMSQWGSESSASTGQRGLIDSEIGTPPKEHRGLGGWLKEKFSDKRERAKSPPDASGSRQSLQGVDFPARGKSMDVPRRDPDQTAERAGATAAAVAAVRNVSQGAPQDEKTRR